MTEQEKIIQDLREEVRKLRLEIEALKDANDRLFSQLISERISNNAERTNSVWHDVIKNPDDLPEETKEYLVKTKRGWFLGRYAVAFYNPVKRSNWVVNTENPVTEEDNRNGYSPWDDVIAWMELPEVEE